MVFDGDVPLFEVKVSLGTLFVVEVRLHAVDREKHVGDKKTRLVEKLAEIKEEHWL